MTDANHDFHVTDSVRDGLPHFILREHWYWPGYHHTLEWLIALNDRLRYQRIDDTNFLFHMEDVKVTFHLEVVRGSLMTFFWNKHARIDDEYILSMEYKDKKQCFHLWSMKGVDGMSGKTGDWDVNWLNWRTLIENTSINNPIGLVTFAKFTSYFLCCLPSCIENNFLSTPMPICMMLDYVLTIISSPCICTALPGHLSVVSTASPITQCFSMDFFNKLTNSVITSTESSLWIPNAEIIPSTSSKSQDDKIHFHVSFQNEILSAKPCFHYNANITSCVRVVEIRSHPLGSQGVIVLLEIVSSILNELPQRYILLNAALLLEYVSGLQQKAPRSTRVLSEEAWTKLASNWMLQNVVYPGQNGERTDSSQETSLSTMKSISSTLELDHGYEVFKAQLEDLHDIDFTRSYKWASLSRKYIERSAIAVDGKDIRHDISVRNDPILCTSNICSMNYTTDSRMNDIKKLDEK